MEKTPPRNSAPRPIPDQAGHRGKSVVLPAFFLALISLPLLEHLLHVVPPVPVAERRRLAERPRFSLRSPLVFLREYESFFNDHFGFRGHLVRLHNRIHVKVFRTSPIDRVVVGRDGWLFMGREGRSSGEAGYFRSLSPFTPAELERWRRVLRQRRSWLERRGIAYLLLIVPNKSTVYPEHMPANLRPLHPRSRLDQLLGMLAEEGGFPVIDLRDTLRREKSRQRLYYRTDSHWTELGAFFAYREIMEHLAPSFPGLRPPALDQFLIERSPRFLGDLAQMLSLQKGEFREQRIRLRPRLPLPHVRGTAARKLGPNIRLTVSESPGADLPAALIVHDSFMHQLQPFLKPRFRRIAFIWDWGLHFFPEEIARERPRLVIDELAERSLASLVPVNPPELAHGE